MQGAQRLHHQCQRLCWGSVRPCCPRPPASGASTACRSAPPASAHLQPDREPVRAWLSGQDCDASTWFSVRSQKSHSCRQGAQTSSASAVQRRPQHLPLAVGVWAPGHPAARRHVALFIACSRACLILHSRDLLKNCCGVFKWQALHLDSARFARLLGCRRLLSRGCCLARCDSVPEWVQFTPNI